MKHLKRLKIITPIKILLFLGLIFSSTTYYYVILLPENEDLIANLEGENELNATSVKAFQKSLKKNPQLLNQEPISNRSPSSIKNSFSDEPSSEFDQHHPSDHSHS
jgi:hypothetical protein